MTETIKAGNRDEIIAKLRRQGLTLIDIQEKRSALSFLKLGKPREKAKLDEIVIFTRQLATMISAGIPLLESLEILQEQQENVGFGAALGDVVDRVRSGSDFSAALSEHPNLFPRIYVSMVKAGETAGQLDLILNRLAEYQEATAKLLREIKSAMTYPVISLTMIFGITAFLLVGIIPKFAEIFDALGVELPLITSTLLALSAFLVDYLLYIVVAMVGAFIAIRYYVTKTQMGRWQFDYFKLKMPIFGTLFQKVAVSRFSRTFATLIKSGVPILGALEIVASTAGNLIVEEAVQSSITSVKQGEPLADPLSQFWVFPPMVTRMISIGERAGALESLLEKISEFYDQQVSATVESLTSLIEPVMIGIMGFVVGSIVLAVFLPIFKLQSQLAAGG
jgi:type IV pilus assembly protein PilC